jgi:hypothetical protein
MSADLKEVVQDIRRSGKARAYGGSTACRLLLKDELLRRRGFRHAIPLRRTSTTKRKRAECRKRPF